MDNEKKSKKLFIIASILLLIGVVMINFIPVSFQKIALAVTGNYNRTAAQNSITRDDWNLLDSDFLLTDGSNQMAGNLNMNNNKITNLQNPTADTDAANKGWVNTLLSSASSIKDTSGNPLKMVCGTFQPTAAQWVQITADTMYTDINTAVAGFAAVPIYLTSIGGAGSHGFSYGATSIYSPTQNSFRVYITYTGGSAYNPTNVANIWLWKINWCGIGQ